MAHDVSVAESASPALSGRASPNPRAGRQVEEDILQKGDKNLRRYAAGVEKALSTFEASHGDWADYIAFLGRLQKALQAVKETAVIPHSSLVSLRLAQCLNPTLPSGVHQKALDVYAHIFGLLQGANLGRDLQVFLPGLLPVLSFASLTVRPLFYSIFEKHVLQLDHASLRPPLKSIILALLPGIEDETSEDFERGIAVLDKLRGLPDDESRNANSHSASGLWACHFWQCFFLAVMTGETRRQGALAYLSRRLPSFKPAHRPSTAGSNGHQDALNHGDAMLGDAEVVTKPEPGLLIRCFAAGLRDQNILVQRGFLDLLVSHIPLDSTFLQQTIQSVDLDLLVAAAVTVVLRRDMSLNRRLWAWFLGPEPAAGVDDTEETPLSDHGDAPFSKQANYFQNFGADSLQRCLLNMFAHDTSTASEKVTPFRISSALMDRWEIGGYLLPFVLIPGLRAAFEYSTLSTKKGADEVIRSASLFFDGIESSLIWGQIIEELSSALKLLPTDLKTARHTLEFLNFVVTRFNVREEDMLAIHIPRALLVTLHGLSATNDLHAGVEDALNSVLELASSLISALPEHNEIDPQMPDISVDLAKLGGESTKIVNKIKQASKDMNRTVSSEGPDVPANVRTHLLYNASNLYKRCLNESAFRPYAGRVDDILIGLLSRHQDWTGLDIDGVFLAISASLQAVSPLWRTEVHDFALVVSMTRLWTTLMETQQFAGYAQNHDIEQQMIQYLWLHLVSSRSKHHVDAVRLLWSIRRSSGVNEASVDFSIFLTERLVDNTTRLEDFERFMTLWGHTIQKKQARSDRKPSMSVRRASNFNAPIDITLSEAEDVLARPLMVILDSLNGGATDVSAVVAAWLRSLPSLDQILSLLMKQLESALESIESRSEHIHSSIRRARSDQQYIQVVDVTLDRLLGLLSHSSPYTWSTLAELHLHEDFDSEGPLGIQHLTQIAVKLMLAIDCTTFESSQRRILQLLDVLFTCSHAVSLQGLQVELSLLQLLEKAVRAAQGSLQVELLRVLPQALKIKEAVGVRGKSKHHKSNHEDSSAHNDQQPHPQHAGSHSPPPGLLDCIKEAMKTPSSRLYLEYWIKFLGDILPLYSQAIVNSMIPLVECFCTQINEVFECIQKMAMEPMASDEQMPTSPLFDLLHGLELVLAKGHSTLGAIPSDSVGLTALSPTASSFFGSSAPVPSPGDPGKTAKSNSRLTVILCVHDAVEICFRMWTWASYGMDASEIDAASAATAAYNSQKIRSRAKKMLEHMFEAEGLESLETVISIWTRSKRSRTPSSNPEEVLSLVNALAATRPRAAMPLILNALYSRTNMDALEASRRSTLTCDLSAADLAAFLLKYVSTTEDDALDEIWADYNAFMRDVLTNPQPHRHVLPLYLELTALLAEKVDNTNFGERQRIHRELADFFSRLLTATFTARPSNGPYDSSKTGDHSGDLVSSLLAVTPKLQSVLETADRILVAVNSITTHAITPNFHSRAFPENVRPDLLKLIGLIATQNPDAKLWKREVGDAFSDARIFGTPSETMSSHWFPVLRKWSAAEKTAVADALSRIVAPSAAALMFGVGANSARLAADRSAQHNLRRVALLLLANDQDAMSGAVPVIDNKIAELCTATLTSAPSCATRADIFMLWRALFLSTSPIHLAGMWPTINATLQAALLSLCPPKHEQETYSNLSLLQACKFLDMLVTIQPDDFQLQEWIFLTNTTDAVYASAAGSASLVDEVAEALTNSSQSNGEEKEEKEETSDEQKMTKTQNTRTPMFAKMDIDTGDVKAMPREDFTKQILLPFFNQLSMGAYEGTYQMASVDLEACRRDLMEDLMDERTVV